MILIEAKQRPKAENQIKYNKSFKDFLKINNIEMYSAYNEGKSVVAERFIRTLKNKIFNNMIAVSKIFVLMC